jgi:chromosomal replication initiation ATPase DnaA
VKDLRQREDDLSAKIKRRQLLLNGAHEEIARMKSIIELNLENPRFAPEFARNDARANTIIQVVMDYFGVTKEELGLKKNKSENVRDCKKWMCRMLRLMTRLSHKTISQHAGYSDHTGCITANDVIVELMKEDVSARNLEVKLIEKILQTGISDN